MLTVKRTHYIFKMKQIFALDKNDSYIKLLSELQYTFKI